MNALFFGSYEADRHPRVRVLIEGLAARGIEVAECNVPLGDATADRVELLRRPWLAPRFLARLAGTWWRLWRRARRLPRPDVVLVGYMGHFDVHLARRIWRSVPIVLDHLVSFGDTAADRAAAVGWRHRLMRRLDRSAVSAADLALVDTEENLLVLPEDLRGKGFVVAVGAPATWFHEPGDRSGRTMRVVFFGLHTPLQGTPILGEALGMLTDLDAEFTMIGTGQDFEACRDRAASNRRVTWLDWVEPATLPGLVADHDICLGIFGTSAKAERVVPNKVYQGAAAGCVVVTSDTEPQRRALGSVGVFVPPGSASSLATTIRELAADRGDLDRRRGETFRLAVEAFAPEVALAALADRIRDLLLADH